MADEERRSKAEAVGGVTRGWWTCLLGIGLFSGVPTVGLGQEVAVPSSDVEWESLRSQLEQNPYLLARADRETALAVVVAALRTRGDGLLWAVYGPGICVVRGPERAQMVREARREAFQRSRECLDRILTVLPSSTDELDAEVVRGMLVIPLAEALLEVGDLEGADSLASRELQGLPRAVPGMSGHTVCGGGDGPSVGVLGLGGCRTTDHRGSLAGRTWLLRRSQ